MLTNGGIIGAPLAWFPRLLKGSQEQREKYELWRDGKWLHWEQLDEDFSPEVVIKSLQEERS